MPKPLCGSQQTVENFKEMGIPDLLTCLIVLEAIVRTRCGTTDWLKIGREI